MSETTATESRANSHTSTIMDRGRRRVSEKPRIATPIGARSTGHRSMPPGSEKVRAAGEFYEFYWSVSGSAVFYYHRKAIRVGPNSIFCYPPKVRHRYVTGDEGFEHYRWTMDGPLAREVIMAYGLTPPGPLWAGPPPADLFQRLFVLIDDMSLMAEREACIVAQSLLLAAANPPPPSPASGAPSISVIEECASRIIRDFPNSKLAINALAEELGVNRSVLSMRFRESFGLSPHRYLTALRMRHALKLLSETTLPISEISKKTGYSDACYFARCVRAATGQSPSEFRNSHQSFVEAERMDHTLKLLCETDMPISDIGKRMGYKSMADFERKVKETTLQTPLQWRNSHRKATRTPQNC